MLSPLLKSVNSSKISLSSKCSSAYEGGGSDGNENEEQLDELYDDEEQAYAEDDIDPDDPYQINRLNDIDHDILKEMYTQVVDELLDLQLEFEEKLGVAEDQAANDLETQAAELAETHQ